jgi:hypothetical protein
MRYRRGFHPNQRGVSLELSLNPTRFAAYAARFGPQLVGDLASVPRHELLRRDPDVRARLEGRALAKWDNYLSGFDRWITVVTEHWAELLDFYINAVVQFVQSDFNARADAAAAGEQPVTLVLRSPGEEVPRMPRAEVYWEFGVRDARVAYLTLERALRPAAPSFVEEQRYDLRTGREATARWISIELREGVTLKVYAKLAGRIRMEVIYDGSKRTIGQLVRPDLHFSEDVDLAERLERLRLDGADRINRTLAVVDQPSSPGVAEDLEGVATVLAEIARLTKGNRYLVSEALSQLVTEQTLEARPRTTLSKIAMNLEEIGLLQRVGLVARSTTHRYVLHPAIARAFERFVSPPVAASDEQPVSSA